MRQTKSFLFSKVLLALWVTFSGLILANDSDKLMSIGRGTKLTLIKNIEVPPNQDYVDFPVLKVNGPQSEFLNWTVYTYVCRLELKESSLDRRVLPVGTEVVLTGEYQENTHADEPYGTVQGLFIQSPSALQGISCGGYAQAFHQTTYGMTSPAGNAYGPIEFTIENFKALFASYWRIERPDPVVIHNR
jgi:hypothetical protein